MCALRPSEWKLFKCDENDSITAVVYYYQPHLTTMYLLDATSCYRRSRVVCRSVYLIRAPCKNGWTDRDVVWDVDSDGPKEPCIGWGFRSPTGRGSFGENGRPIVKYRDYCPCATAMRPFVKLLWPLVIIIMLKITVLSIVQTNCSHFKQTAVWYHNRTTSAAMSASFAQCCYIACKIKHWLCL